MLCAGLSSSVERTRGHSGVKLEGIVKIMKDFDCLTREERMKEQGLFSLEKRRLGEMLPMCLNTQWDIPCWGSEEENHLSVIFSEWTRHTFIYKKSCVSTRKIAFYCKIVKR